MTPLPKIKLGLTYSTALLVPHHLKKIHLRQPRISANYDIAIWILLVIEVTLRVFQYCLCFHMNWGFFCQCGISVFRKSNKKTKNKLCILHNIVIKSKCYLEHCFSTYWLMKHTFVISEICLHILYSLLIENVSKRFFHLFLPTRQRPLLEISTTMDENILKTVPP